MGSSSSFGTSGVAQYEEGREMNFYSMTGPHWGPGTGHMVGSHLLLNTALPGRLYELPEDNSCVFSALQSQHLAESRHQ